MKLQTLKQNAKIMPLVAAVAASLITAPAGAQNPTSEPGDLLVYFLQNGGSQTVIARLSLGVGGYLTTAPQFRDATTNTYNVNSVSGITNLGGSLTAAFGNTWYEDTSLWWGAIAVKDTSQNTTDQVDGDPSRTIYVTRNRNTVGTPGVAGSTAWGTTGVPFVDGNMTTGSNNIFAVENFFEVNGTGTSLSSPTPNAVTAATANPFTGANPGTTYGMFTGGATAAVTKSFSTGLWGTFDGISAESGLDLYRMLASTSAAGQVGGPLRRGSFEGTLVIDQTGSISYIVVPEPASATLVAAGLLLGLASRRRRQVQA